MSTPTVFASAEQNRVLGLWVAHWFCWQCGVRHHFTAGPTSGPPRGGHRRTPCGGAWIHVVVKPT